MTDLTPEARARLEELAIALAGSPGGDAITACLASHDAQAAELSRLAWPSRRLRNVLDDPSTPRGERGEGHAVWIAKRLRELASRVGAGVDASEGEIAAFADHVEALRVAPTLPVDVAGLVEEWATFKKKRMRGLEGFAAAFSDALDLGDRLAAALEAAARRPGLPPQLYTSSGKHLSGYRVCIGYETLKEAQAAHEFLALFGAPDND